MTVRPERAQGLGRGLAALIPQRPTSQPGITEIPLARIRPNPYQPRQRMDEAELATLTASIAEHGVIQPILVSETLDGYELVAGQRRLRAAQAAGLERIPAVIRQVSDPARLELALVENLQRADLSPVDEAQGYRRLINDFNQTQEEIAHTMGKSRPHIANTLRLLDLPEAVREMIRRDALSAGHGRALLAFPDPQAMAERVVAEKLSVRDLERLAAGERLKKATGTKRAVAAKSADTRALEKRIEEALGLKVSLSQRGGEKTVLSLEIDNYDQLDTVVERLTRR